MARPFIELVRLNQNTEMSKDEITSLLVISKDYPRVTSRYEKLKADTNLLENEISNLAKDRQRLSSVISNLHKPENQLQLATKELQVKYARELQRERTENFVKQYEEENVEYNKIKKAIQAEVEDVLGD
jgi:hypothetical protein